MALDEVLASERKSRERSIVITKLQEALGMDLKELGTVPNSYNPENAVVDPTADGLKL